MTSVNEKIKWNSLAENKVEIFVKVLQEVWHPMTVSWGSLHNSSLCKNEEKSGFSFYSLVTTLTLSEHLSTWLVFVPLSFEFPRATILDAF